MRKRRASRPQTSCLTVSPTRSKQSRAVFDLTLERAQVSVDGAVQSRTIYAGLGGTGKSLYERTEHYASGTIEHVHFLYAGDAHGGSAFAVRTVTQASSPSVSFSYNSFDHLGSITAVSDEAGQVLDEASGGTNASVIGYDAWGARRNPSGTAASSTSFALPPGHRGFTGHEAIPNVGLINMNGRVYDPAVGRFLSPDPNIQFPTNAQSYNRYSYVLNNPLRYADPTGYFLDGLASLNIAIAFSAIVACGGTGGVGCGLAFAVIATTINTTAMIAQGAQWDQAVGLGMLGLASGMAMGGIGSMVGSAVGELTTSGFGQVIGGAVGGTLSAAYMGAATGHVDAGSLLSSAAQGALWASVAWATAPSAQLSQASQEEAQGDGPGEGRIRLPRDAGCNASCEARIEDALNANPDGRSATGRKFYVLTGESGGDEYGGKVKGLAVARFSTWAVDAIQPIVDELDVHYDVASTKLYIGGPGNSVGKGAIRIPTPGNDVGSSFARTARSVMHEIGHQLDFAIYRYDVAMAVWKAEDKKYGDRAYFVPGSKEWQSDYFANEYLPRIVGQ